MERVTVWTNDFYWTDSYNSKVHEEVDALLAEGKAVRVGASCIGHTRAAMVESEAERYFEKIGAVKVYEDWAGAWYALAEA